VDKKTGEVLKGRIIHLQSVDAPGYEKAVAKINGICEGGLKQCMAELRIKGASSSLKGYQNMRRKFFKENFTSTKQMSSTELTIESVNEKVDNLSKQLSEVMPKIEKGEVNLGVKTEVKTENPEDKDKTADVKKIQEENENLKKSMEELQTKMKEKEEAELAEKRLRMATEMTEAEIKLHEIPLKEKEKRIKFYNELKDGETLADLKLLHKALTSRASTIKGASGFSDSMQVAHLSIEEKQEKPVDYMALHERFSA
jgi:hypothetical protein